MAKFKDAIVEMEKRMTQEQIHDAKLTADREILSIKLAKLRERQGIKQADLKTFTQTAVSRLEKRKDMKISTLIEYLDDIGMGIEIRVYNKTGDKEEKPETLLKS